MNKPFSDLIDKDKNKKVSSSLSTKTLGKKVNKKSNPLIICGFLISLSSIFLLLYTINNKFGWLNNLLNYLNLHNELYLKKITNFNGI